MKSVLAGALGLIVFQLLVSSKTTAGSLGTFSADMSKLLSRFVDPTVPAFGSSTPTTTTTVTTA